MSNSFPPCQQNELKQESSPSRPPLWRLSKQERVHARRFRSPDAILLSWAAGPSLSTFFTCRNSSVRSPPMMVNPNPWALFFSAVWYISPFSWLGSAVKPDAPPLAAHEQSAR